MNNLFKVFVYSVIDEVDSILVDEARTPLIISGKVSDSTKWYTEFTKIVKGMKRDVHYDIDEAKKQVHPTELGIEYVESKTRYLKFIRKLSDKLYSLFNSMSES